MRKAVPCLITMVLCAVIQGCGGYSPQVLPAVKSSISNLEVAQNKNFSALDYASFNAAEITYPSRGSAPHRANVGDYFAGKLVSLLSTEPVYEKILLRGFAIQCNRGGTFAPKAICSGTVSVSLIVDGRERIIDFSGEKEAGPLMVVGDIAPPFNWGGGGKYASAQFPAVLDYFAEGIAAKAKLP